MYINNLTNLIAAQTNVAWLKEVEEPILTKEFMAKHGLKGSPKLSKQLINLGMHPDYVALILSSKSKTKIPYKLWTKESAEIIVRLQGNSHHFESCQKVKNPTDLKCWDGKSMCAVTEDVIPYLNGTLMFITIGNSILEDGEGWKSRAKLRLIRNKRTKEVALYLDRVYGNTHDILEAAKEIAVFNNMKLYTKALNTNKNKHLLDWVMPSARYGYQDSPQWIYTSELVSHSNNQLLFGAYIERQMNEGVYDCSLSEVQYNPQNNMFHTPNKNTVDRSVFRNTKRYPIFHEMLKVLNISWADLIKEEVVEHDEDSYAEIYTSNGLKIDGDYQPRDCFNPPLYAYKDNLSVVRLTLDWENGHELAILSDCPELGFYAAQSIDACWGSSHRTDERKVYIDEPELGWAQALPIDGYWTIGLISDEGEKFDYDPNEQYTYVDAGEDYDDEEGSALSFYRVVKIDEPEYGFAKALSFSHESNPNPPARRRRGDFDGD